MYSVKHFCRKGRASCLVAARPLHPDLSQISNLNSILSLIILFNLFLFNVFRCWDLTLCLGSDCLALSIRACTARLLLWLLALSLRRSGRLVVHGHLGHRLRLSLPIIFLLLCLSRLSHLVLLVVLGQDLSFTLGVWQVIGVLVLLQLLIVFFLDGLTFIVRCALVARLEFLFENRSVSPQVAGIKTKSFLPG